MEGSSTDQIFVKPISQPHFQSHVMDFINRYVSAERNIIFDYNHYLQMGSIKMEIGWFADHAVENIRQMGYMVHRRSEMSESEWNVIRSDILALDYTNATFEFNSPLPPPQQQQLLPTSMASGFRWSDNYNQESRAPTIPTTTTTAAATTTITTPQSLDDEELTAFLSTIVLSSEEYGKRRQMLVELHKLLNFGTVHPIGSVLTGLAGPMSDVDVCFSDAKGRNKKIVLQEVADLLRMAGVEQNRPFCQLVNIFPEIQVPMLTFVHLDSKFQCDLYIDEHGLSIHNSKLIKFLLSTGFHPLSSPLVIFLRHWAHSYQLIGGKNGLKSYTLALLVIVFLVRKKILPSIQLLQSLVPMKIVSIQSDGDNGVPASQQQRWNINFSSHFVTVKREMSKRGIGPTDMQGGCQKLLALIQEFFDLMTSLSSELIVCTVTGEFLPISNFEQISQNGGGQKYRMPSSTTSPARFIPAQTIRERLKSTNSISKWIVQDPIELSVDLMADCSGAIFTRFLLAMKETSGRIRTNFCQNRLQDLFIPSFRFEPKRFEKLVDDQQQQQQKVRNEQPKKPEVIITSVEKRSTQNNLKQKSVPVLIDLESVTVLPPSSSPSPALKVPTLTFIIHPEPKYMSAFFGPVTWPPSFEHELDLKLGRLWYMSFLSFFKDSFGSSLNVFEWTTSRISVGVKFTGVPSVSSSKERENNQIETESLSSADDDDDMTGGQDQSSIAMETTSSSADLTTYRAMCDQIKIQRKLFQDRSIRFEFSLPRPTIQNLARGQLYDSSTSQTNGVSSSKGRQPFLSLEGQQGGHHGFNCEARFQLKEFRPMVTVSISEIPQLIPPTQSKVNGSSSPSSSSGNFLFLLNDFAPTLETFVRGSFGQYAQKRLEHWLLSSGRQSTESFKELKVP